MFTAYTSVTYLENISFQKLSTHVPIKKKPTTVRTSAVRVKTVSQGADAMLVYCWTIVCYAGPTVNQHYD